MLQYEWRTGVPIAEDDALPETPPVEGIIPQPFVPGLPDPNPQSPTDALIPRPTAADFGDHAPLVTPGAANEVAEDVVPNQAQEAPDAVMNQAAGASPPNNVPNREQAANQGAIPPQAAPQTVPIPDAAARQGASPTAGNVTAVRGEAQAHAAGSPAVDTAPATEAQGALQPLFTQANSELSTEPVVDDNDGTIVFHYPHTADNANGTTQANTDQAVPQTRHAERQRRQAYWDIHTDDSHGRGKRQRKQTEAFSFLQKRFADLSNADRLDFFEQAHRQMQDTNNTALMERFTTGLLFAQMSAKKGIEKYGDEAERKLIAEFTQLLQYKTFHGRHASELTHAQKRKAANMINIIEEKINRGHTPDNPVIKARSVFNGRMQRGLYTKEETTSPTVSLDAFLLTSIVDAMEGRDVAITDVRAAYLNAKMDDVVIMKIRGPEVDIFVKLDPDLAKFVTTEKNTRVLYVQLDKALYGCIKSALLWYELYSTTLVDMGFQINPYDLCVANADIDGTQCTICWYVDDNKISHINPTVVDKVITNIESKFGKMTTTRGKAHEFLGMDLTFDKGAVRIGMKKHILKILDMFGEPIKRTAATPAQHFLFHVRDNAPALDEARADIFHSVVAALLFVSRRCRLDIQTAIGFLSTRVSCPTEDDWFKLYRVLQYLKRTIDLVYTISCDDIRHMFSWIDVSYGVHIDCKSHTGGCVSFGRGVLLTKCQKQKLNVKSSTEGEIVGVSDFLPNMIWARMFLSAQGFDLTHNTLFQDNQSAMKIICNGKRSSGPKTKHMDTRYFWIKDRLVSEGINVVYCPTSLMVADFFTKALQGKLFKTLRDVVLGYTRFDSLTVDNKDATSQERVRQDHLTGDSKTDLPGRTNTNPIVPTQKTVRWADVVRGSSQ